MRTIRLVFIIVALLVLSAAGVLFIASRIERQRALARQAEEIAAHRQAQRAEPPPGDASVSSHCTSA